MESSITLAPRQRVSWKLIRLFRENGPLICVRVVCPRLEGIERPEPVITPFLPGVAGFPAINDPQCLQQPNLYG